MTVDFDGEDEAGTNGLTVQEDRARARVTAFATNLRALHTQGFPQDIEEGIAGLDIETADLIIECYGDPFRHGRLLYHAGAIRGARARYSLNRRPESSLQHDTHHV